MYKNRIGRTNLHGRQQFFIRRSVIAFDERVGFVESLCYARANMKIRIFMISACLVLNFGVTGATCQNKSPKSVDEIKEMIKRWSSDDAKASEAAEDELSKLTADSIPNLFKIAKKENACTASGAVALITKLDPTYPELVPTITKLVRGGNILSLFNLQKEVTCRREAAYLLPMSAEGLKSILNLLQTGDTWEKQTAIFALDDFTEVAGYNDRPGEVEVMRQIVPALAKLQKSKDKVISEMSSEVLTQISGEPPKELAELAQKLVKY